MNYLWVKLDCGNDELRTGVCVCVCAVSAGVCDTFINLQSHHSHVADVH